MVIKKIPVNSICPYCNKSIRLNSVHYEGNKAKCSYCKNLVKKFYQVSCPSCNKSFKATWGQVRKGNQKCPSCGKKILKTDLPDFQTGAPRMAAPVAAPVSPPTVVTQTVIKAPETSYKQTGVLCLACRNVSQLGNKKCQSCKTKIKVKPSVMIYFNGIVETVQCQKCGGYTDFKQIKCQACGKKLKL